MKVINIGMPRSGTKALAILFKRLGIESHHQMNPCFMTDEKQFLEYDLNNPSPNILALPRSYKEINKELLFNENHYFDSDWAKSPFIYLMEKEMPFLRFTIIVRNIVDCCNSLMNYRLKTNKNNTNDINYYADKWIKIYEFIYKQMKQMTVTPYVIDFHKYINGELLNILMSIFDIELNNKNIDIAKKVFSIKVNNRGEYESHKIDDQLIKKSIILTSNLFRMNKKSWRKDYE